MQVCQRPGRCEDEKPVNARKDVHMSIGPVILNGVVTASQDYSNIKQNADNKGMLHQQGFQVQLEKQIDVRHTRITENEQMRKEERKFDAREKGDNEYFGDGGKRKQKKETPNENGKVIVKGQRSFDIKI